MNLCFMLATFVRIQTMTCNPTASTKMHLEGTHGPLSSSIFHHWPWHQACDLKCSLRRKRGHWQSIKPHLVFLWCRVHCCCCSEVKGYNAVCLDPSRKKWSPLLCTFSANIRALAWPYLLVEKDFLSGKPVLSHHLATDLSLA